MTLIEFILIVLAVFLAVKLIVFITKRTSLLISVLKLAKLDTVEVKVNNFAALYLPIITKRAAFLIKVRNTTYSVWLYNGKGHSHAAHIVNETYSTVFIKSGGAMKVRRFVRSVKVVHEAARVYFPKTVFLPDAATSPDTVPILLFTPAPRELTYVTPERTSIKAAFTGDVVFGFKVFTKSTLAKFIDRDTRGFYDGTKQDIYSYDK